jgi:hypothetical protein
VKGRAFTIVVTAAVTSILWYGWHALHTVGNRIEHVWLVSAVKVPGRMALDTIQADLEAGRYDVVKLEVEALRKHWAVFSADEDDRGPGIGNIMTDFSKLGATGLLHVDAEPRASAKSGSATPAETDSTTNFCRVIRLATPVEVGRTASLALGMVEVPKWVEGHIDHSARKPGADSGYPYGTLEGGVPQLFWGWGYQWIEGLAYEPTGQVIYVVGDPGVVSQYCANVIMLLRDSEKEARGAHP